MSPSEKALLKRDKCLVYILGNRELGEKVNSLSVKNGSFIPYL